MVNNFILDSDDDKYDDADVVVAVDCETGDDSNDYNGDDNFDGV